MDLSNLSPATKPGRDSASTWAAGRPACFSVGENIVAALHFTHFQVFGRQTLASGKADRGRRGDALRAESTVGRRAFDQVFTVGLARGQRLHIHGQPARGSGDADITMFQVQFFIQPLGDVDLQLRDGQVQVASRQFFDADLKEQRIGESRSMVESPRLAT